MRRIFANGGLRPELVRGDFCPPPRSTHIPIGPLQSARWEAKRVSRTLRRASQFRLRRPRGSPLWESLPEIPSKKGAKASAHPRVSSESTPSPCRLRKALSWRLPNCPEVLPRSTMSPQELGTKSGGVLRGSPPRRRTPRGSLSQQCAARVAASKKNSPRLPVAAGKGSARSQPGGLGVRHVPRSLLRRAIAVEWCFPGLRPGPFRPRREAHGALSSGYSCHRRRSLCMERGLLIDWVASKSR